MEKCFAGKSASLLHTHIYQALKGGIQVSSDNKRWNTSKCVKQEAPLPRSTAVSHQDSQGASNVPLWFARTIHLSWMQTIAKNLASKASRWRGLPASHTCLYSTFCCLMKLVFPLLKPDKCVCEARKRFSLRSIFPSYIPPF